MKIISTVERFRIVVLLTMVALGWGSGTAADVTQNVDSRAKTANITGQRIILADQEPGNWLSHGRTYSEQRYSPLDSINRGNVADLGLAWYFDTEWDRGLEASPIVVDGRLYATGAWSIVYALDAKTGKLLWKYDPKVPKEVGYKACCDVVNRGVAVWKGRVYSASLDGRLVALDAETGRLEWEVQTTPTDTFYTITGAPRVVKDKVIIGNGGADYGVRGFVSAYDANTGAQVWRVYTVPGDPSQPFENPQLAMAAKTWKGGEWWKIGGGGTVWDSMAYDPDLDLLYFGSGNGSPWSRHLRSPGGGDNLFLSSIIAVRPDTGEYAWHYQTTPGDNWDYTATQHLILAELDIEGAQRKVIMQAPKNGFFYVIDRETGEFISANNYVPVNWATHVDPVSGRPVENPEVADHSKEARLTYPTALGGHNWHPMSYSPRTGLVYIPANDAYQIYHTNQDFEVIDGVNTGLAEEAPPESEAVIKQLQSDYKGKLIAWDPIKQREAWHVKQPDPGNGGTLVTAADLVFQGTNDAHFYAYNAATGKRLWGVNTDTPIMAPPVTYSIDGEQYVAVMAGWGGVFSLFWGELAKPGQVENQYKSRLLVYKLGGQAELPAKTAPKAFPEPPKLTASEEELELGNTLYHRYCQGCHGIGAMGGQSLPDLRYLDPATRTAFVPIVHGGAYQERGMIGFHDKMSIAEVEAIHSYLIKRAHDLKQALQ